MSENKTIKLTLTEEAYPTGRSVIGAPEWEASAVDKLGNHYIVTWYERNDYDFEKMEADMSCDWDSPYSVRDNCGKYVPLATIFNEDGSLLAEFVDEDFIEESDKKTSLSECISSAEATKDSEALNGASRDGRDIENER